MGCTREKIPEKRLCLVRCIRSKSCPFWEELEWDALSSPVSLPPSYSFDVIVTVPVYAPPTVSLTMPNTWNCRCRCTIIPVLSPEERLKRIAAILEGQVSWSVKNNRYTMTKEDIAEIHKLASK